MKYLISLSLLFTQATPANNETHIENVEWHLDMEEEIRELQEQNAMLREMLLTEHIGIFRRKLGREKDFGIRKVVGIYDKIVVICDCLDVDVEGWHEGIMPIKEGLNEAIDNAEKSCEHINGKTLGVCVETT